jgi:hypothetical protein
MRMIICINKDDIFSIIIDKSGMPAIRPHNCKNEEGMVSLDFTVYCKMYFLMGVFLLPLKSTD